MNEELLITTRLYLLMSKGLGRIERLVLDALERESGNRIPLDVVTLAYMVHNGLDCWITSDLVDKPPYAVYQSVCRAVRNLERKGLVRCGKTQCSFMDRYNFSCGGVSWRKVIRLVSV